MCGIVAYVGRRVAQPLLVEGLKRLEYRGYDSSGVAIIDPAARLHVQRSVGRIASLGHKLQNGSTIPEGRIGVAHTRWATYRRADRGQRPPPRRQ